MLTTQTLAALVDDDLLPSRMPDVGLLFRHLKERNDDREPICLSFGETWSQVAPGLVHHLRSEPVHSHGYQLSMYGLPALRRVLRDQIQRDHRIPAHCEVGRDFEVAVTWTGTRSAMFDFGRLIRAETAEDPRVPVVVAAGPSWDYEGVFGGLGFEMRYLPLTAENGFRPSADVLAALLTEIDRDPGARLALLVVNAQHNPTAVNWDAAFVAEAMKMAVDSDAAILIDDAYYAIHDPDVTPTSALAILLDQMRDVPANSRPRWLMVRSLGKQFHSNGWGIGAVTADPALLDRLVNRYRLDHGLMYGGSYQHAMYRWLTDPESQKFLNTQQSVFRDRREMIGSFLVDRLGYAPESIQMGECTSYVLLALPRCYADMPDGLDRFRLDCFDATSVLLAPSWPWPYPPASGPVLPYMRMFIGPESEVITTALQRMESAGFHFNMQTPVTGPRSAMTVE